MMRRWFQTMAIRPWLRISLAALLIIAGLAPVGAPILSDNTWRQVPASADNTGSAALPFFYRWTAGDDQTRVQRSDDGGQTWHDVAAIPQPVAQLEAVRGDEQTILARSPKAIWISRDGGASWTLTAGLPSRPLAMTVGDKASGLLLAGTESAGLQASRDMGATWAAVNDATLAGGGGAPLAVTALTTDTEDGRIVYAATGIWLGTSTTRLTPIGVFASVDGGRRWLPMAQLPLNASPVTGLKTALGHPLALATTDAAGTVRTVEMKLTSELLALLDSEDAALRTSAARAIGLIGDTAALPALLAHLHDTDALAGDEVAGAIGRLADAAAIPALTQALSATDEALAARAAYALGILGAGEAVPQLAETLRQGGPMAARRAAEALAAIGTDEAMNALAAPLADAEITPARHAAMAGLELAGARAVPALTAALGSQETAARANSAEMLGWLKAAPATPALATALSDSDLTVRAQAAWALGEVATPEARQILAQALSTETDAGLRRTTEAALARAETAAGDKSIAETSFWSGLLEAATAIPAGRWTLMALFVVLAGALLMTGKPRHTHLPRP